MSPTILNEDHYNQLKKEVTMPKKKKAKKKKKAIKKERLNWFPLLETKIITTN